MEEGDSREGAGGRQLPDGVGEGQAVSESRAEEGELGSSSTDGEARAVAAAGKTPLLVSALGAGPTGCSGYGIPGGPPWKSSLLSRCRL
ncbi:hypothetical protein GDO81_022600 [Engystomops pustulosus]|uniref:Uncharacterized protein n=1 Tax=Engystomops pustulosus TaxID=76066 RepID=A0AAV6YU90_ENGPU|nr:hypothetical protein GDO81_022600 [Engystomops pustulosus]